MKNTGAAMGDLEGQIHPVWRFSSRKVSNSLSQKVTYLFCDELDIVSKELRSRVRQATKDVVKSEV